MEWDAAYRRVPSRFPPRGLFDRVSHPEDLEATLAVESLTNDRLRDEVGAIVPKPSSLLSSVCDADGVREWVASSAINAAIDRIAGVYERRRGIRIYYSFRAFGTSREVYVGSNLNVAKEAVGLCRAQTGYTRMALT